VSASWILLAALVLIGLFAASRAWPVRATQGLRLEGEQEDDGFGGATLSVATYNIHRARGLDGEKKLDRIAELVKSCDVVGLQRWRERVCFAVMTRPLSSAGYSAAFFIFPQRDGFYFFPSVATG